jgi:hypothetical protein
MAVTVARPQARSFSPPRARVATAPALALLVCFSAAVRVAFAWLRATPTYLPDEYMYAELARSIADTGRPLIRGVEASFPALLQPLVTAPFWLVGDVELSFRLVQLAGSVAMSLAAVPAFLLARRAGASRGLSLGVAVLAAAVPDLLYAGWVIAEPFAYPLVLGAVVAGVSAVAAPSRRSQLAFLGLAALATFARAQFAVLPLCFAGAVIVAGLRERRLRDALREQSLPFALLGAGAALLLVLGRERLLGIYRAPFGDGGIPLTSFPPNVGPDLMVLALAAGWILVPGALLGLALAVARPRSRGELAFGAVASLVTLALVLQAALFGDVELVQERYLFYVVPLAGAAFALYAGRGWPHRRTHLLLAGVLLVLSARVPVGGWYVGEGKEHSPLLMGVSRLEPLLESSAGASAVVAAVAAALSAAAVLCSLRPRAGGAVAMSLAVGACLAASAGAVEWDTRTAANIAAGQLPAEQSFVDAAGAGPVAELLGPGAQPINGIHAFWNRTVDRVLLLPGAQRLDPFTNERMRIARDGTLAVGGGTVRSALLVDEYATTIRLHDARRLAKVAFDTLWDPRGAARLALVMHGRFYDGRLGRQGDLRAWTDGPGTLVVRLRGLAEVGPTVVTFGTSATRVVPGRESVLRLPVCSAGSWDARFEASESAFVDGRAVAAQAGVPEFVPASQGLPRGCR